MISSLGKLQTADNLKRGRLEVLQVNMGNLCNQSCRHCHIEGSPQGNKVMSVQIIERIVEFLKKNQGLALDITGGAPELNPHFDYFINRIHPLVKEIIVRSNLTVYFEPGKEYLPEFFKKYSIRLICSLPCFKQKNVDLQRGSGVFQKSIEALKILNTIGYGKSEGLFLDLVYNPLGAYLPPRQEELERDYRLSLRGEYGIEFNNLITITNAPIKRFRDYLHSRAEYEGYLKLLRDNFNPRILKDIMCKRYLSVGYDGRLYDCDFNQSLGWALKDAKGDCFTIDGIDLKDLYETQIMVGEHCFSCTAGYGSSCQGALTDDAKEVKQALRLYYGKILKSRDDLKTSACCYEVSLPAASRKILAKIHPEIKNKFYGCGSPLPPLLEGCRILDLGCGSGGDVYIASALAGRNGFVIGVDMTQEQLARARAYLDYQMREFGFSRPNIEFRKGYIEDLKALGIEDNSLDVVISNCVINLSCDKKRVFSEIWRVLKPGAELYFSDIFTARRMPPHLKSDPVLYSECLGGALYIEDFRRILTDIGCLDYRVVSRRKISLDNPEIESRVGMIDFYSMTIRVFKLQDLEDICEDYGQIAIYSGGIVGHPHRFILDEHHIFITGKPTPVCGNTASMLLYSRYAKYFRVIGERTTHFGPFNCSPSPGRVNTEDKDISAPGGACC
jgi:radical SAM/Cys-rich protein